jgi:hypothetical protein
MILLNPKHMQLTINSPIIIPIFESKNLELSKKAIRYLSIILFLNLVCFGKCTGITFVDSTKIAVCHNKRIFNHKVFKDLSKRGKSTVGWFYGFKLHF